MTFIRPSVQQLPSTRTHSLPPPSASPAGPTGQQRPVGDTFSAPASLLAGGTPAADQRALVTALASRSVYEVGEPTSLGELDLSTAVALPRDERGARLSIGESELIVGGRDGEIVVTLDGRRLSPKELQEHVPGLLRELAIADESPGTDANLRDFVNTLEAATGLNGISDIDLGSVPLRNPVASEWTADGFRVEGDGFVLNVGGRDGEVVMTLNGTRLSEEQIAEFAPHALRQFFKESAPGPMDSNLFEVTQAITAATGLDGMSGLSLEELTLEGAVGHEWTSEGQSITAQDLVMSAGGRDGERVVMVNGVRLSDAEIITLANQLEADPRANHPSVSGFVNTLTTMRDSLLNGG